MNALNAHTSAKYVALMVNASLAKLVIFLVMGYVLPARIPFAYNALTI
jgi:hypothetical protein